jgi:ubiquitin C-terminal hydrolase
MQINMGGPADKTLSLSKLPPVLAIHVLRFNINDKRSGHVKFEENLDAGEYLDPRYQQFLTAIINTSVQFEVSDLQ